MIKQCSWCERYETGAGFPPVATWVKDLDGRIIGPITHGICPACSTYPELEYAADRWAREQARA